MLSLKMGTDTNQIVELWIGLSPHLVKAISGQELLEDGHAEEKRSNENNEGKITDPIESRHGKDDV